MGIREEKQRALLEQMTEYEKKHWANREEFIAGMDEAGRGPLAGPVVAACVIMPKDDLILGINDSKKLAEKKRNELYEKIIEKALDYQICIVDEKEIDRINILNATKQAFQKALEGMKIVPQHIYTDAMELNTEIPYTSLVKADQKVYTVAAASILAKVTRDRMMLGYHEKYPEYSFNSNKGYGTKAHYEAIAQYGILDIHRKTFLKNIKL